MTRILLVATLLVSLPGLAHATPVSQIISATYAGNVNGRYRSQTTGLQQAKQFSDVSQSQRGRFGQNHSIAVNYTSSNGSSQSMTIRSDHNASAAAEVRYLQAIGKLPGVR